MLRQIFNFQKLAFMNTFSLNATARVEKAEKYATKSRTSFVLYIIFIVTLAGIMASGTMSGVLLYVFELLSMVSMSSFFQKDRTPYEMLPVKKRFIVGNVMIFYLIGVVVFTVIGLLFGTVILLAMQILDHNAALEFLSRFDSGHIMDALRLVLFVFIMGYCLYVLWLVVQLTRTKWIKTSIAGVLMAVTIATALYFKMYHEYHHYDNDPISSWIKGHSNVEYWLLISAMVIFLALMYTVCVRMYKRLAGL